MDNKYQVKRSENFEKDLVVRLNRIEGQIRGINKMVSNDNYCDDILIQISSVQSALNSVSKKLLENHIKTCVVNRIKNGDEEVIDELLKTFMRASKM